MVRVTSVALQAAVAHSAPGLGMACLLLAGIWLSACPPALSLVNTNRAQLHSDPSSWQPERGVLSSGVCRSLRGLWVPALACNPR